MATTSDARERPSDTGKDWNRRLERQLTLGKTRTGQSGLAALTVPPSGTITATKTTKKKCPQGSGGNGGENDEPTGDSTEQTTSATTTDYDLDYGGGCQCVCGKTFKTPKGMKIHRTKKGCSAPTPKQRSASARKAGKTSETPSPVENHSAGSIQAKEQPADDRTREKIKFPKASQSTIWTELDNELSQQLRQKVSGTIREKISIFGSTIYDFCKNKFGIIQKTITKKPAKPRRQKEIEEIRRQKKDIRRQWKAAQDQHQKDGLKDIWNQLKKRHSELCKAERTRKRKREQQKCKQDFIRAPFQFARKLFEQPKSGNLQASKEELEDHLRKTYSDKRRHEELEDIEGVTLSSAPKEVFNTKPPRLAEIQQIVRKARCKSAPGPNGVPYLVYKKCPKILKHLHSLLVAAWKQKCVSNEWTKADGVYIPKEKDSKTIGQFRPISLLNVEGKVFFAVVASRLTKYLMNNGYVDTSVQKGGVPGIPGCLEHASMIWEAIQRAKTNRLDLHVIWLDLANAYGSVPHSLLWKALEMHHVPDTVIDILKEYFSHFKMRFTTASYTTGWTELEVGIAMGCTVSPILFVLAMQVLLKATEAYAKSAELGNGICMPPLKAFMDDTTVIVNKVETGRDVLARLDSLITWSRMKFKPSKSRSLSLRKGKVDESVRFQIGGQDIPKVSEEPVKSLGRWYDCSLKDTKQNGYIKETAKEGLVTINKTQVQGKFKVWILQFMLIPKLLWPLLVYEIGLSTVESIERMINRYTRKWLGLPPGLTTVALYSRNAKLKLPLKSIIEEYKTGKTRLQMMLKYSNDPTISSIEPKLKTGRKWKADKATADAEEAVKMKEIIGATQTNRNGVGFGPARKWWSKASNKEKRELVIEAVKDQTESERFQTAVQQSQQGQWTTWEDALQRSLSWNDIWHMAPLRLSFIIRSIYDQLPTANNLTKWNLSKDTKCALCNGNETLSHVLSGCKEALASGRYTWRHNQVLQKLAEAVDVARKRANTKSTNHTVSTYWLRPGSTSTKPIPSTQPMESILDAAKDWTIATDLPNMRNYPDVITDSNLRPDMVLTSEKNRTVVVIELTVPYEANMSENHEYKLAKYEGLRHEIHSKGYKTHMFAVEIGARGLAGASAYSLLKRLGLSNQMRSRYLKQLAEAAERASCWIWTKRKVKDWTGLQA